MAAQVISFNCILKNRLGQLISNTSNREVLTSTGQYAHLKALSVALENLRPGEKRTVTISAGDAYGFYNPKLSCVRMRKELEGGDDLKLGELVKYFKDEQQSLFRVTEANSVYVTLDGNHPLAGQDLVFEIEATESRAAMPEEVFETLTESASSFH
jgi:FKBP-type peptidyl-prolyl cis-trans isomerase SlyD